MKRFIRLDPAARQFFKENACSRVMQLPDINKQCLLSTGKIFTFRFTCIVIFSIIFQLCRHALASERAAVHSVNDLLCAANWHDFRASETLRPFGCRVVLFAFDGHFLLAINDPFSRATHVIYCMTKWDYIKEHFWVLGNCSEQLGFSLWNIHMLAMFGPNSLAFHAVKGPSGNCDRKTSSHKTAF